MTMVLPILLLLVLFFVGMPIGFALGMAGLVGLYMVGGPTLMSGLAMITPYETSASFVLSAVPLFILMAEFTSKGRLAADLFDLAHKWLGHVSGGLAVAAVAASAAMGAMSGSSTASAAAIAGVSMPEMDKHNYQPHFSAASVAMGGTLAIMIPPSIPMVIYGAMTENSIGQLFVAGIIPGLMLTVMYGLMIMLMVRLNPALAERVSPFSYKERFASFRRVWAAMLLIVIVIGGMYTGVVTPTEAGALGAVGALVISLALRRINLKQIVDSVYSTARITVMLMTIVVGAHFFSYYLTTAGVSTALSKFLSGSQLHPILTLILFIVPVYIVLGCFMDNIPILLLTLPVVYPVIISLGFDPIWFGILVVQLGEIGLVTPPVGLNVFVVSASSGVPLEKIFRGILPLLSMDFALLALLIAFPQLALFLPALMK